MPGEQNAPTQAPAVTAAGTLQPGQTMQVHGRATTITAVNHAVAASVDVDGTQHTVSGHYSAILRSARIIRNDGPGAVRVTVY